MDFIKHMPQEKPIWFDDAIKFYVDNILNHKKEDSSSEKEDSSSEKDFPDWFTSFAKRISKLEDELKNNKYAIIEHNLKHLEDSMNQYDELRAKDDMIQTHKNEINDQQYIIKSLKKKIVDQEYKIKSLKVEIEHRTKIMTEMYNKMNKFYGINDDTRSMERSLSACSVASSVGSN
ncbi:hypothetical protein PBCVAN69C_081L [Paramecium bursaria Chlorella virus AN69C]|uniref:Uncharacterized protein n=1 Tax=Paramecium bursaria Chlorella virus IL3A TaxID=46019 RepID=M1HVK3_PBCVI|nr:hypothetical protein PBCVAN69C_081L [Paramecium bursaria Chlorella virus AN69C]AGE53756.1 hypothetical protein PBCVIL3A_074L [Paramecium bursaria Chlorella virus IL3A]